MWGPRGKEVGDEDDAPLDETPRRAMGLPAGGPALRRSAAGELVERDPDIDTAQQASIATDSAVLDMRSERRELGIGSYK